MNKRIPELWKSRSSKFHQNATKDVYINCYNNEFVVWNAFADHFISIYSTSYNHIDAKRDFDVLCVSIAHDNFSKADLISMVNVESVDRCNRKLKLGKSCGPTA